MLDDEGLIMKRLIVRCDDFGLTQGCSLGILRALENGCISSVGSIVNTGLRGDDARVLSGYAGVSVGLHVNVVAGKPLSDPRLVRGLVDCDGCFYASRRYRCSDTDLIDPIELEREATAQVERFKELFCKLPAYIDCHSVATPHVDEALTKVAEKYGVPYVDIDLTYLKDTCNVYAPKLPNNMDYDSYDPLQFLMSDDAGILTHESTFVVFHPAFLDQDLMEISSLREGRIKDQAALSSLQFKTWLAEHGICLMPIV